MSKEVRTWWLRIPKSYQWGLIEVFDKEPKTSDFSIAIKVVEASASQKLEEKLAAAEAREADLLKVVSQYHEYFKAIERGEYDSNRRPAPLRDFEMILQASATNAIEVNRKARGGEC